MIIIHYFQLRGDKYGNHWYLSFTQNSWRCQYSPCNLLPNAVVEHDMEFNFIALIEKRTGLTWCMHFFPNLSAHLRSAESLVWLYINCIGCMMVGRTVMTPASWFWGQNVRVQHVPLCLWKVMSDKFSVWSTPKLEWSCVE